MTDTPHFAFPFRLGAAGRAAVVVEQDSDEEIIDCVEVLLSTELGERVELPDYGIEPQTFKLTNRSLVPLTNAVRRWESRADAVLEREPEGADALLERIRIKIKGTTSD